MIIIDIDEIKKLLPGYSPDKAEQFHEASSEIAKNVFNYELKNIKNSKVILMCGGSASGKTEFIDKFLIKDNYEDGIIFESTMSTNIGAEIRIKKIKESKNIPIICFIFPNDLEQCFAAFNKRDRKIPRHRFYETHSGARKVVLYLANEYPEIEIFIYTSYYESKDLAEDRLVFKLRDFKSRKEMIDFLKTIQYSEKEIFEKLINK